MYRGLWPVLLLLVFGVLCGAFVTDQQQQQQSKYISNEWVMAIHAVNEQDLPSAEEISSYGASLLRVSYSSQARMAILLLSGAPLAVASFATSESVPVSATRVQTTPNARVSVATAGWALQRISQRNLPLSGLYQLPVESKRGNGSHIWVVDTGVSMHPDLAGRVRWDYTAYSDSYDDCYGHGTHVAASAAGTTFGVAPEAIVHSVRVLDCSGSGSLFDLAVGLAWIRDNAPTTGKDVINLSLAYGSYDPTIDFVIQQLITKGFSVQAASGNSGSNACFNYPSASVGVNSIGASSITDNKPSFSNYGSCVTLFAPGVDIESAWLLGGSATLSGTSMAAGFVSGAVALMLADSMISSPALVTSELKSRATAGVLNTASIGVGSPNLLLFVATSLPSSSTTVLPPSPTTVTTTTPSMTATPKPTTTRRSTATQCHLSLSLLISVAVMLSGFL